MSDRLATLNTHLTNLIALESTVGGHEEDIANTLLEINKELGIGIESILSSYSTKELHDELINREAVTEVVISNEQEASVVKYIGEQEHITAVKGPARILINKD